jgi:hypothetical protein
MRRVVVTPTFAAGLGVVVAAVLAYPMRTVFSYAAPGGSPCEATSCGTGNPAQAGGQPASGGGQQIGSPQVPVSPNATAGSRSSAPSAQPPGSANGSAPTVAAGPDLSYWTSSRGAGHFGGRITISFQPGTTPAHWQLRFGYPAARILRVWAGKALQHGTHTAVVRSEDWPAQPAGNKPIKVTIGVTGEPGPPGKCTFNGEACTITQHHAAKSPPASQSS